MTTAPMKLTEVLVTDVDQYIDDPSWVMEQKMDGARALLVWSVAKGFRWNSWGGKPLKFAAAAQHIAKLEEELLTVFRSRDVWAMALDGELMTGTGEFKIFDAPWSRWTRSSFDGVAPYSMRRDAVKELLRGAPNQNVTAVPVAHTSDQKRRLWEAASNSGVEGVVVKALDGSYQPGGRSTEQRKLKFVKTADVVVTSWSRSDDRRKGSAAFGAFDSSGQLVNIGSCSLIGKPDVAVGDVIEVAYLYRADTKQGGLIQPRMIRVRPDRPATSCTFDQFPSYSREVVSF